MSENRHESKPSSRWVLARYLGAALAARTADEGTRVALVLLALRGTGSAAVGGALVAALLVPHVVAAPAVGAWIDRSGRPRWVLATLVLVFAASLLSVALLLGRAPLWVVLALLLGGGSCGPAVTGGLTSQLPGLLGAEDAPRAFGLDSLFYNLAGIAGPALAGIVAATAGPAGALTLLAVSAAIGAAGIATLPIVHATQPPDAKDPGLLDGVREILRRRTLRVVTLSSTVGQIGPGALPVVAAVLAVAAHRPAGSGLLLSTLAAGSLVGSLLCTWRPVSPQRSPLVVTVAMIGVGTPIALAAAAPWSWAATAVLFGVSGVFVGPFASALFTARSHYAGEAVRTQVFTVGAGLKVTASALGAALVGLVAQLPAPTLLLLVASSPILAGVVGALLVTLGAANERGAPDDQSDTRTDSSDRQKPPRSGALSGPRG